MAGLYFEEFEPGMEFKHALTRTVTEMDNVMFCALTHNPQPLHLDEEFAKETEFGQRIVNSLFTLGLVIGVTVGDTTLGTTIGNLGMTDVRLPIRSSTATPSAACRRSRKSANRNRARPPVSSCLSISATTSGTRKSPTVSAPHS